MYIYLKFFPYLFSPVGWDYRLRCVQDMTLKNLIVKLK